MSVLNVSELFVSEPPRPPKDTPTRRRSNSQSRVVGQPPFIQKGQNKSHSQGGSTTGSRNGHYNQWDTRPPRRPQSEYYVTLMPLNDTFVKKYIHVPYYPETVRLGRPTGTKIKPHVSNGYFDSRVLLRNHACMFVDAKTGLLMLQDMGLSNGTFVNLEKLQTEPVVVSVGDTINLGFNIQLETSHKQISARIDNITVVSNNPTGPVLGGLPALNSDVIAGFSATEMRHLDFIQSIFAKPDPDDESPKTSAFDLAMFADVAPLDATLDTPLETPAGVFSHSRIAASTDVEGALDALSVNIAKVTQQNATLRLLEKFLTNYATQVDAINARSVAAEVARRQTRFDEMLATERTRANEAACMAELRSTEHRDMICRLESEIAMLRADLLRREDELHFTPVNTPTVGEDEEEDKVMKKSLETDFEFAPRLIKEISPASDVEDVYSLNEKPEKPYLQHLGAQAAHYKNQGVMLGFFVVVAGLLYQSSR